MIDEEKVIKKLQEMALLDPQYPVEMHPLRGGVSSDILMIDNGAKKYVVKKARLQLKVDDLWEADVSRNTAEQRFIQHVGKYLPGSVAEMIYSDPAEPFFIMEFLDAPLENWKEKLLQGRYTTNDAVNAANLLSEIHHLGRRDPMAGDHFDFKENFFSLRIEPYLLRTGTRNPELEGVFYQEAMRLKSWAETLVHGDFSPKNILVSSERMVLLDHEVANFGDPAFDIAFFINHLLLKKIHHRARIDHLPELASFAWSTYFQSVYLDNIQELQQRTSRLILMLMLARVDGKSPVEYLDQRNRAFVKRFVYPYLKETVQIDFEQYHDELNKALRSER